MLKSEGVTAITPLLSEQIKSTETSDFTPFRSLLIFNICSLACIIIALELFVLIGTIICFLEILSGYVEFWFIFQPFVVSDIMDFNNLARGQFGKSILDFDDFLDIAFRSLYVYMVVWIRSLSI